MKTKNFKVVLIENDKPIFDFNAQLEYNEENEYDEGEVTFMHPFTGEMYTDIHQCLVGWSEQNQDDNITRETLAYMVASDSDLLQRAWDIDEGDEIVYYVG